MVTRASALKRRLELLPLFLTENAVVLAPVACFLVELHGLLVYARRDRPHALAHALVSLAVLLDALLDLALVETVRGGRAVGAAGTGVVVAVRGGREAVVGRDVALFETALDLDYGLLEQYGLVPKALEDLSVVITVSKIFYL